MLHLLRWEAATHRGNVTWQVPGIVCNQKYSCERQSWRSGKRKSQSKHSYVKKPRLNWLGGVKAVVNVCYNNIAKWRLTLVKWQISIAYRLTVFVTVCVCHSQRINFRAIQERHKESTFGKCRCRRNGPTDILSYHLVWQTSHTSRLRKI